MISEEDIKNLAKLARVEVKTEELFSLSKDIDAILEYVGQVKSVVGSSIPSPDQGEGYAIARGGVINAMREDKNPTESGTYNKELIAEFPNSENNYLKVKKIL